jgi:hypothetical protein
MPEPDPQPPQPRPISAACWLLMLTPSVIAISAPFISDATSHALPMQGEKALGVALGIMLLMLAVAAVLCFVLGFLLGKWRGGDLRDWSRPIGFGILILIVNGFISFGGCAVLVQVLNL